MKKRLTKDELDTIRKNAIVERPRTAARAKPERKRRMTVSDGDYRIFAKAATAANVSVGEFMHTVALAVEERNPKLFS